MRRALSPLLFQWVDKAVLTLRCPGNAAPLLSISRNGPGPEVFCQSGKMAGAILPAPPRGDLATGTGALASSTKTGGRSCCRFPNSQLSFDFLFSIGNALPSLSP